MAKAIKSPKIGKMEFPVKGIKIKAMKGKKGC